MINSTCRYPCMVENVNITANCTRIARLDNGTPSWRAVCLVEPDTDYEIIHLYVIIMSY